MPSPRSGRRLPLAAIIGPGLLVAATGVGAGDLLTASLGGSRLGLTLLWAAWVGAVAKWFLNEGVARWQMATGTTLLEGWTTRLGGWTRWLFLAYLLPWTVFTGGALVNACGVAGTGVFPLTDDLRTSKIIWGVLHAAAGAVLVWFGGFRLFERLMSVCIAVMFVAVVVTAVLIGPDLVQLISGLFVPRIPANGLAYTLGILGGVGGTVTLLSYGYWIRERDRSGAEGLATCRVDLGVAYTMTALFGMAMIVIGSRVEIDRGPTVALELAGQLALVLGPIGKWLFLMGFWGAVFSSLLGVWQSVPYLFADFVTIGKRAEATALSTTRPYRLYLLAIPIVSVPLLWLSLERAQLSYAVMGAFFMPLLALTLLWMNNRQEWVGTAFRNRWMTNIALSTTLIFFLYVGLDTAVKNLGGG